VKCVKYFCPFYCDSLHDNLVGHIAAIERCRGILRGGGKPKIRPIPILQKNGKRGESLKFYHLPAPRYWYYFPAFSLCIFKLVCLRLLQNWISSDLRSYRLELVPYSYLAWQERLDRLIRTPGNWAGTGRRSSFSRSNKVSSIESHNI
jgi:hypothetical protein